MVTKGGAYQPRIRKRKALARMREPQEENDENAIIGADGQKVTGKKAKRLQKYIDLKLKKDENKALKERLAKNVVDTSLFASSKTLGQTKMTKREKMRVALIEERKGIAGEEARGILMVERRDVRGEVVPTLGAEVGEEEKEEQEEKAEEEEMGDESSEESEESSDEEAPPVPVSKPIAPIVPVKGGGLKRPLEMGDDGRPVMQKRQKRGGVKSKFSIHSVIGPQETMVERETDADEWNGFSGEDTKDESGSNEDEESDMDNDEASGSEDINEGNEEEEEQDSSEEESEDEPEDESPDADAKREERKARSSAFKDWASEKRNEALGYTPVNSATVVANMTKPDNFEPRPMEQDPLPLELQKTKNDDRKAFSVAVTRTPEIQEARLQLPIVSEEQKIMEAVHNNDVVVICGTTGSGKTTQVPQFLYEAGYGTPGSPTPGMIGITQPRRVAAISMSKRVAEEMGDKGSEVAYQIRFEGNVEDKTAIKFMTDGLLLREMSRDAALKKYSAVIIDEAHERSLNTDILLGLLSELIRKRNKPKYGLPPLKLIIMSATLRITDLTENPRLFRTPPPVLDVEGKQYPVSIHFSGVTKHAYVDEALKKIKMGHKKLPAGGMLIFLTGQNEIHYVQKKLKQEFGGAAITTKPSSVAISGTEIGLEAEDLDFGKSGDGYRDISKENPLDDYESSDTEDDGKEFDIQDEETEEGKPSTAAPLKMHVLPLYSLLPVKEQSKVFQPPPPGHRLVVLATNIAETSLTIPNIRYVFDCGRAKERQFHKATGIQSYDVGWISQASASQRAGRAGRTAPGHCYRLFSSAVYERDFEEFARPEILRMPIEGVVLELKAKGRNKVEKFPFPTAPEAGDVEKAERLLGYLLAVDDERKATRVGETLAMFPLAPRIARILIAGHREGCLPYVIAIVAGLSAVGEVYVAENSIFGPESQGDDGEDEGGTGEDGDKKAFRTVKDIQHTNAQYTLRQSYGRAMAKFTHFGPADVLKLMSAILAFSFVPPSDAESWCKANFVSLKTMNEVRMLRKQLTRLLLAADIAALKTDGGLEWTEEVPPPTERQVGYIKQMVATGYVDQVAIRGDLHPAPPELGRGKPRRAIDVAYVPLQPLHRLGETAGEDEDRVVFIHPSSPMSRLSAQECPDYIVYRQLQRPGNQAKTAPGGKGKTRMLCLTDIDGRLLAGISKETGLLRWGKPMKEVRNDGVEREGWFAPEMKVPGTGGLGWGLPPRKVVQRKVTGRGWVVVGDGEREGGR